MLWGILRLVTLALFQADLHSGKKQQDIFLSIAVLHQFSLGHVSCAEFLLLAYIKKMCGLSWHRTSLVLPRNSMAARRATFLMCTELWKYKN